MFRRSAVHSSDGKAFRQAGTDLLIRQVLAGYGPMPAFAWMRRVARFLPEQGAAGQTKPQPPDWQDSVAPQSSRSQRAVRPPADAFRRNCPGVQPICRRNVWII